MKVKITTLVENSLGEHLALRNEHGLSFLIEIENPRMQILFDTGQSGNFIYNAGLLDVDLAKTDKVVLSHGHYDHSGRLKALCKPLVPISSYWWGPGSLLQNMGIIMGLGSILAIISAGITWSKQDSYYFN